MIDDLMLNYRSAGNYGRLALVRKDDDESKWTQLFFAPDDEEVELEDQADNGHMNVDSMGSVDYNEADPGFFSWIAAVFFTLKDEHYLRKCGIDAVQYLKFQRHLIAFMAIMTVVCICVILPINFQGDLQGKEADFGHTTISNLGGTDQLLWIHVVIVILFFPLGIFIMRKFSVNLKIEEYAEECISGRTLMISGIPERYCNKNDLTRHFNEAYPDFDIEEIQIAYDVSALTALDIRRERAVRARQFCENYVAKHGAGQQMRPRPCGMVCGCCGKSVDALTFYTKEEEELTAEVEREKLRIRTKSIGIAFVTFTRLSGAKRVRSEFGLKCYCRRKQPSHSSLDDKLKPCKWGMRFAPPPEDIYWQNLSSSHNNLFIVKALVVNIFLFLVLFFFTSPTYIISQFQTVLNISNLTSSQKINDFLPTLMLWTLSALLPIIVGYSDWLMGHWRRSVENLWIMRKVFFYLLLMVLILPSIGLTTARGVLEFILHSTNNENIVKYACIFLPDNGAFFVNYVITSALVGTALELMRFSELFMYAMRMLFARSVAETPSVRKANVYEFPFGFNYGWMLLIFALTSAYAVVCPLITPFGLFYLCMKHAVDRYNLYFAYKPSKIDKNIHATAVNCVIISLLIQQLILLFFNIVRSQGSNEGHLFSERAIFSLTMLCIFSALFFAQVTFHIFKGISPLQYNPNSRRVLDNEEAEDVNGGGGEGASSDHQDMEFSDAIRPASNRGRRNRKTRRTK